MRGCRFDPQFEIMQDWDFFLQIAQHTHFHFEPRQTFEWHADAGPPARAAAPTRTTRASQRFRDMIYAKWAPAHEALADAVTAKLQAAQARAQQRDFPGAESIGARGARGMSPNDPFALNMLAMLQRAQGRIADARKTLGDRGCDPARRSVVHLQSRAPLPRGGRHRRRARGCCWRALETGFQVSLPSAAISSRDARARSARAWTARGTSIRHTFEAATP